MHEIRELVHGIYPPLLRDNGLVDAVQAVGTGHRSPATVEAIGIERYDLDIETALYFWVVESVQNAGKHAEDDAVITIRLGAFRGWVDLHATLGQGTVVRGEVPAVAVRAAADA